MAPREPRRKKKGNGPRRRPLSAGTSLPKSKSTLDLANDVDADTRSHKSAMGAGKNNVMVAVRVRPFLKAEKREENIKVLDERLVVVLDPARDVDDILRQKRSREMRYAFDYAFDQGTTTSHIYDCTTKFLLDGVMNGFNATVFAYGQTGTGKTHTMLGVPRDPGIITMALQDLFKMTSCETELVYQVRISYIEVYNELIKDLLGDDPNLTLDLREDPVAGPTVAGLKEYPVAAVETVLDLVERGNKYRAMEPTKANEVSSRSHAVLQITVEQRDKTSNTKHEVKIGKLTMIDLAGSERASVTDNRGMRLVEGANINRSLLALGNCINALGDKSKRGAYVPYRDSKLTRLLKDSLGGNCRTVMIATVSPLRKCFEDTHNTLKYANRAKNIKTKMKRNVLKVDYHVSKYTEIISDLRGEIQELKKQMQYMETGEGAAEIDAAAKALSASQAQVAADAEEKELARLRQVIHSYFDERMQLRRSLIELNDQVMRNNEDVQHLTDKVGRLERRFTVDRTSNLGNRILETTDVLHTISRNMKQNVALKKDLESQLQRNEERGVELRKNLYTQIRDPNRIKLLQHEYRIHVLELENVEGETQLQMQQKEATHKDDYIKKLEAALREKDVIIHRQRALLKEHGIDDTTAQSVTLPVKAVADEAPPPDIMSTPMPSGKTKAVAGGAARGKAGAGKPMLAIPSHLSAPQEVFSPSISPRTRHLQEREMEREEQEASLRKSQTAAIASTPALSSAQATTTADDKGDADSEAGWAFQRVLGDNNDPARLNSTPLLLKSPAESHTSPTAKSDHGVVATSPYSEADASAVGAALQITGHQSGGATTGSIGANSTGALRPLRNEGRLRADRKGYGIKRLSGGGQQQQRDANGSGVIAQARQELALLQRENNKRLSSRQARLKNFNENAHEKRFSGNYAAQRQKGSVAGGKRPALSIKKGKGFGDPDSNLFISKQVVPSSRRR